MREELDGGRRDEEAVEEVHEPVVVIAPLERAAAERMPPFGVRHERIGVVRADRVEHEEHEQAAVREVAEPQAMRGEHEQRHRDEYDGVLEQPVLAENGIDREREPDDAVDREQARG